MRVWGRQSVLEFDLRLGNWTIIVTDPAYFPPNASKSAFQHMPDLRILFLGMNSGFSTPALHALLAGGYKPGALIMPPPAGMKVAFRPIHFPISGSETPNTEANLLQLASRHGVPIYEIGSLRDPRALDLVRSAGTDLIITACFPRLLPESWLEAPRLGALNLHPSLLPAYRGPQPLFWQFRLGETDTGVTLHFMDAGADTGEIVSQARVPFPSGISEAQAETLTGQASADLLLNALADPENIPRRPQPVTGASRQSAPGPQDLEVPVSWEVRRAFNFIRGAQAWGPFEVEHANGRARVSEAEAFVTGDPSAVSHQPQEEGTAWLEMRGGALQVRLAESSA